MNTLTARRLSKLLIVAAVFICSATLLAQQPTPHGVPPPLPNTPDTERDFRKMDPSRMRRRDRTSPTGKATVEEIRRDFLQIQILNNELLESVNSTTRLDYKYIADTVSKIKELAGRLDTDFALGKSEGEQPHDEYEPREPVLKAAVSSLHDLVISFVENPVFMERGVLDIERTKKAKQDVDKIMAVSDQIRKLAKRLSKNARK